MCEVADCLVSILATNVRRSGQRALSSELCCLSNSGSIREDTHRGRILVGLADGLHVCLLQLLLRLVLQLSQLLKLRIVFLHTGDGRARIVRCSRGVARRRSTRLPSRHLHTE